MAKKPVVLCILDGWGDEKSLEHNAPKLARTPAFDHLIDTYPNTHLIACGLGVGLPDGQMGNSEVGHMNIGAGRTVMQSLPRINIACADKSYKNIIQFENFVSNLNKTKGTAHLLCLLSDGGVHAHQNHLAEMANTLQDLGVNVAIHAFADGRDTAPQSAQSFMTILQSKTTAPIKTVCGRYWSMDRDTNWDRVRKSYDAIALGQSADHADTPIKAIHQGYRDKISDEFINATVIGDYDGIKDGDGIFCLNFRSDRSGEILSALLNPEFKEFERKDISLIKGLGMVQYSANHSTYMDVLFPPLDITNTLGQVVAEAEMIQIRTAETEKYPHVTFFFNGGQETPFKGEERLLSPSPKVATYDMQPEMSAYDVTENLINRLEHGDVDMVILNFANPDMVGHTGCLKSAILACEAVDTCLGKVFDAVQKLNGTLLVTADHGNCDIMYDVEKDEPHTAHTMNPVNFIVCGAGDISLQSGVLGDIAPTMLQLLQLKQPIEMTGKSLIL